MSKLGSAGRQFLGSSRQPKSGLPRPRRQKRIRGFLPIWEPMEDRTLLSTMLWANPSGGAWDVASNWVNQSNPTDQHVPTSSDDAEIDYTGITVTFSSGDSDAVNNLTNQATLDLSSGTLDVTGTIQSSGGQLALEGATLGGGTTAAGTTLVGQSGTLDGVTIDGDFQVLDENSVTVTNGLTLNGTATLGGSGGGNWGTLDFSGSQTLAGSGTVMFNGPGPYNALAISSGTLTIGPSITVQGGNGYLGYSPEVGGSPSYISVVNQGTIEWANGANISIESTLTNSGTISVDGTSTLNTGGTISGGTITTQAVRRFPAARWTQ